MTTLQTRQPCLKELVGLSDGQQRLGFVPGTKRSGWFNKDGRWVGWGDLTNRDMVNIASRLKPGEQFIVVHEEDSYRRFLKDIVPDPTRILRTEDTLGLEYVAEHAMFLITPDCIFPVSNVHPRRDAEMWGGISYQIIDNATAEAMILDGRGSTVH
jgi:hypothetical protein